MLRDCSFRHPTFQAGRVEIALSEVLPVSSLGFLGRFKGRRLRHFKDSAEIATALLASSTLGISGLPFTWRSSQDNHSALFADGAFTDFMPEIDEHSVKVKPFSDGLNFLGRSWR